MARTGGTEQPREDEDALTAAANLEIGTQSVYVRAHTKVPATEAANLLDVGRALLLLAAAVACLIVAGTVAVQAQRSGSPVVMSVVGVALLAALVLALAARRFVQRGRTPRPRSFNIIAIGWPKGQRLLAPRPAKPNLAGSTRDGRRRGPTTHSARKAARRRNKRGR